MALLTRAATATATALAIAIITNPTHAFLGNCPRGTFRSFGQCIGFTSISPPPGFVEIFDKLSQKEDCDPPVGTNPGNTDYRVCDDGTVSFVQPAGLNYRKITGERYLDIGVCGPTAVANVLCMQCGLCEEPISWLAVTGLRKGGGTTDVDLLHALNSRALDDAKADSSCPIIKHGAGYRWEYYNDNLFTSPLTLKDLEYHIREWRIQTRGASPSKHRPWNFNPVMVGLNDATGNFPHVTTVVAVNLENKTVTHNTWGQQC